MATTIKMPQLGESVTEGTIERWLVKEGDTVEQYDPLFEVVTDKVNAEVPAEVAGTITKIMVPDGETVKVGTPLAEISADGEAAAAGDAPAAEPAAAQASSADQPLDGAQTSPAAVAAGETPGSSETAPAEVSAESFAAAGIQGSAETGAESDAASRAAETAAQQQAPTSTAPPAGSPPAAGAEAGNGAGGDGTARMTPVVRRLVREHGVDVAQIRGSGAGGRVTREDVLQFVQQRESGQPGAPAAGSAQAAETPAAEQAQQAQPAPQDAVAQPAARAAAAQPAAQAAAPATAQPYTPPAATAAPTGGDTEVALSQMRRGIAAHMVKAKQTVPHAYTVVEVDMTNVVKWREAKQPEYKGREGIGLSFVTVVVKAVTEALRKHPTLNSQFAEDRIVLKQRMNIGIAVAVDQGLIVPVIKDADQLSISGVNRQVNDLAARARTNKLRLDDIQGGTFTVNNTGWFGSVTSMPIVNAPEVAILSMEAIVKRPVVVEMDGTDVIAIRHMMNLVVSFDHRVLDGAQVGAFLQDVRSRLESWSRDTAVA